MRDFRLLCLAFAMVLNLPGYGQFDITSYAYEWDTTGFIYFHDNTLEPGDPLSLFKSITGDQYHGLELLSSSYSDISETWYHKYQETFKGLDVQGAVYVEHIQGDYVVAANGKVSLFDPEMSAEPTIEESTALSVALEYLGAGIDYAWDDAAFENELKDNTGDPSASYYPKGELLWALNNDGDNYNNLQWLIPYTKYNLAYKFEINAINPRFHKLVYVHANNGNVFMVEDLARCGNADHQYYGSAVDLDTEYDWSSNNYLLHSDDNFAVDVHTKYYSASQPFNNVSEVTDADDWWGTDHQPATNSHYVVTRALEFTLSSGFSGLGSSLLNHVGPVKVFADAPNDIVGWKWEGNQNLITIGKLSNKHAYTLDIAGHEYEHAINYSKANLHYYKEHGALDESYADIYGFMVERWVWQNYGLGGTIWNWTQGEKATTQRNMSNPSAYGHPDTYQGTDWVSVNSCAPAPQNDYCGVHTNSGVQNYWFFLLSDGGSGTNDNNVSYNISGIGIDNAFKIVLEAMLKTMGPSSDYGDARSNTIAAAKKIFGSCSYEHQQTIKAWEAVGVTGSNPCSGVGESEFLLTNNFELFPNPANLNINVRFKDIVTCHLEIFSIHGEKIRTIQIAESKQTTIDVSDMPVGVYFISQANSSNHSPVKFIVN